MQPDPWKYSVLGNIYIPDKPAFGVHASVKARIEALIDYS